MNDVTLSKDEPLAAIEINGDTNSAHALTADGLLVRLEAKAYVLAPPSAELGVEIKELFVLERIDEHPHPASLAEALVMPKPTVTVYLKKLEAAGLVKREIDASDLRRHRITLTAAGRKVMTKGSALLADAFAERLSRLSSAQLGQFADILAVLA